MSAQAVNFWLDRGHGHNGTDLQSAPLLTATSTEFDAMPVEGCNTDIRVCSVHRTVEYRLLPGSKSNAKKLAGIAGACPALYP